MQVNCKPKAALLLCKGLQALCCFLKFCTETRYIPLEKVLVEKRELHEESKSLTGALHFTFEFLKGKGKQDLSLSHFLKSSFLVMFVKYCI